jgi:hypothetical protein
VLGVQRVRPGAAVTPRPVGTPPAPPPAARREPSAAPGAQPTRSALNPVNTASATERP